uniref:Uncharacterized protein n=1 Tax=Arundo donax TaxID=35708 RepID=A0A0A9GF91_ARUDO
MESSVFLHEQSLLCFFTNMSCFLASSLSPRISSLRNPSADKHDKEKKN